MPRGKPPYPDFDLFLADFDVPLRRIQVDISRPRILDEGDWRASRMSIA